MRKFADSEMVEMWEHGASGYQIARNLKVCPAYIYVRLRKLRTAGVPLRASSRNQTIDVAALTKLCNGKGKKPCS